MTFERVTFAGSKPLWACAYVMLAHTIELTLKLLRLGASGGFVEKGFWPLSVCLCFLSLVTTADRMHARFEEINLGWLICPRLGWRENTHIF